MANLNGTWLGTYWQRETPTRFEATFLQSGNTLTGNILDDSSLGEAIATGEVVGRRISFTKRYHSSSYTVSYTGQIAESEDFMQGEWKIGASDSGSWEAHRSGDNLTADLQSRQLVVRNP